MRPSYRTALRVKGIRPLPAYDKLRSSHQGGVVIDATEAERKRT